MSAQFEPHQLVSITPPDWTRDAVIYQINTRQFTPEGTFTAAAGHLSRLKTLGVDILWLMPIHPIGEKNRKGRLGSPYSVKDYRAVSSELGDLASFKDFISRAHALGFKVIIDWVPNHSAWDNELVTLHPQWYARDYKGDFTPTPWWDWSDIIDFDYSQPGLRQYMLEAMKYWVTETDIDGFRCDVAGFVPNDFWADVRRELDVIKPVFMLAEWEARDLHFDAFDMTYAWSWNEAMHGIAMGRTPLSALYKYYSWNERAFPKRSFRMTFVSNHDKNAWDGTQHEQFGDALEAAIVLSVLGEGMPLIYNSQEAGESKRLAFFERDPIEWQDHAIGTLYRDLIKLKKSIPALHNGEWGATMILVPNTRPRQIFSFVRHDYQHKVLIVLNLSSRDCQVSFEEALFEGDFIEFFSQSSCRLDSHSALDMPAWSSKVFVSNGAGI